MKLISLVATLAFFVACGSSEGIDPGANGGPDPDTPVTSGPGDDPSQPAPDPTPSYTEPQPGQLDVRPIAWESYNIGSDDRLYVSYWSGVEPCYVLDRVEVEYLPKKVFITLFEGHSPADEDTACIEIAMLKTTIVELDEPLGDRKVLDGAPKA